MKKPRIFKYEGYWRVSPKPRPYWKHTPAWNDAHALAKHLNEVENG